MSTLRSAQDLQAKGAFALLRYPSWDPYDHTAAAVPLNPTIHGFQLRFLYAARSRASLSPVGEAARTMAGPEGGPCP